MKVTPQLKQQAARLVDEIEVLRQQAERASVFNMKPILEKMGALQSEFNALVVEAMSHE